MIENLSLADAWLELGQAGRLLDRKSLDALPPPPALSLSTLDALRDALTSLPAGKPASGDVLSALFDVVLERACGLRDGWRKGPAVGAADTEKLLDGTQLKPRRVWTTASGDSLALFAATDERIGVGRGRRSVAHVVEYLRRRRIPLGILSNGREWRLVWADSDNLAWVEWSADRWLDGDQPSATLRLLRAVLSPATLVREDGADLAPLPRAIRETRRGQAKLSKELGERVRRAVETLLQARRPVLDPVWAQHEPSAVYTASCHFVMRLVVTLFAEARGLLPTHNAVYHQAYGLRGLLESLDRAGPDRRRTRHSAWPRLLALFQLLHQGSYHPALAITAYGGALFRKGKPDGDPVSRALAVLESLAEPPDDETVHRILVLLTRTTERVREGSGFRTVAAPVDFSELTSEYIGILYEGLLDYELHRAGNEPIVFLSLGDQPALPLDRLEAMSDKALASLVEKATVKKSAAATEDEAESDEEEDSSAAESEPNDDSPEEDSGAVELVDDALDDSRAAARRRALAWASRAALAGKLVKAPRGKKKGNDDAARAELERVAATLLADVKLPGELYLVRWGGTRKGAGTFYTRPQLTLPTVRRTLEPLLVDETGKLRAPEDLLALKVCDPAMGSGSFLVAALRVLTEAVVRSLHEHERVVRKGEMVQLECPLLPDGDREQREDRIEAIVRRAVVEHCIYGVDLDPLAVELGRVALWIETLDERLPFTFLDHKLRCGNALVGTWLDRFRDYPLLAWWRQSPDEKWKGVHHEADVWSAALKDKRKDVVAEQAELLGQLSLSSSAVSDDELKQATERMRELYRRLRKVPASKPDERARIWQEQISPDPALARVREAFDTWCALWFWPLDRLDAAPGPKTLASPSDEAREIVKRLRNARRFFHWEIEFPDVFSEKGAGFSAIVGNPPWEIQKPNSKEFFTNLDPLYRGYGKQEALSRQRELFDAEPATEHQWLEYLGLFKDLGNFVRYAGEPYGDQDKEGDRKGPPIVSLVARKADETKRLHRKWAADRSKKTGLSDPEHPFRHQGSADLNTYKMFVEAGLSLLVRGGQLGVIVPASIYSDLGSTALRSILLDRYQWRWLYSFWNQEQLFPIDSTYRFCVVIAGKTATPSPMRAAFFVSRLESWGDSEPAHYVVDSVALRNFSPRHRIILNVDGQPDLDTLAKLYANGVLLADNGSDGWDIEYATGFHMTNDSKLFVPRDKAEADGYAPDEYGRWIGPTGDVMLPLYEGRMIGQFDPCQKGWLSGRGRGAQWREIPFGRKAPEPQFLLHAADVPVGSRALRVGLMDVTRATVQRTTVANVVADTPTGNSAPTLSVGGDLHQTLALCAVLNSFTFDFIAKKRCSGLHLNYFVIEEIAIPRRLAHNVAELIARLTAPLAMCADAFAPWWIQLRRIQEPTAPTWAIAPAERLRLRCMIDASISSLYGLRRREVTWMLKSTDLPRVALSNRNFCRSLDPKGFWRVDKDLDPELRHTVLTLVAFDALEKLIEEHGGDRDAGIAAFCALNDGEGWMIPETLRLADYGLGHDDRAKEHQPVASRLGPRFLDWQLAQTAEESWAECERHARAILGDEEFERRFGEHRYEAPAGSDVRATPRAARQEALLSANELDRKQRSFAFDDEE